MTFSAPPEQAPRAPLDRPGDPPSRRVARLAGIFFVITLYDDGHRAGVDGPLTPVFAAPEGAAPVVAAP